MSKITPKNLSYDSTLPPFLARLQANNSSRDDRHEFTIARPKKARTAEDEAEDEPVYFNEESGETLTKSEWEAREAGEETAKSDEKSIAEITANTTNKEDSEALKGGKKEEKVAAIGVSKKRKVGKIVGGGEDEEPAAEEKKAPKQGGKKVEKTKSAKKGKKIKLSFGDDE